MAKKKTAASKKKTTKRSRSASASGSRKKTTRKKTTKTPAAKTAAPRKSTSSSKKPSGASKKKTVRKKSSAAKKKSVRKKSAAAAGSSRTKKPSSKKSTTRTKSASRRSGSQRAAASAGGSVQQPAPAASPSKAGEQSTSEREPRFTADKPALSDAKAIAQRFASAAGLRPVEESAEERALAASRQGKRLTKSPLTKRELDKFRKLLLEKRAEVLDDVSAMEEEALRSNRGSLSALTQHMADQGSDEYEQSLSLGLAESQRKLLAEIDKALERIEHGEFGICSVLGVAIPKERLEARPWAKTSLEGARLLDRGLVRDTA